MLLELRVADFAIIDNVHIEFSSGFNVLSGETGAGKSVLLKSLALLMGAKADSDSVRTGAKQALIEGYFDISARDDISDGLTQRGILLEEDSLVVRRVISRTGKSKVYMNGSLVTLNDLRNTVCPLIEVTGQQAPLIEMTGQHDNKYLQTKSYHLDLLDQYIGAAEPRQQYLEVHTAIKDLQDDIDSLASNNPFKEQRLDFLKFQQKEIERLDLDPGDEDILEKEIRKLKSGQRIIDFIHAADSTLYADDDSALARIQSILKKATEVSKYDSGLEERVLPLKQASSIIEDCLFELNTYLSDFEGGENNIDVLESKLDRFRKLQKKYGATVLEIQGHLEGILSEIDSLENQEKHIASLRAKIDELSKTRLTIAKDLHQRRIEGAKLLSGGVNDQLKDLNMKGLSIFCQVEKSEEFYSTGFSKVELLTQTSKKDLARSLSKYASGGELSRILLAIKCIVGASKHPRTYLFDEVDTGVSGETAEKVGRKLHEIAQGQQVVCVTHLPQVAAFADTHFLIQKEPNKKKGVQMSVTELSDTDKVKEVARLISGEKISATSLKHAQELINSH